jgi:hypothetical protein
LISLQCDDKADITIFAADDQRKPIVAYLDLERRGKIEGIVFDLKRNGKWDFSYLDVKFNDTFPVKGLHPDPTSKVWSLNTSKNPMDAGVS